jgi:hypothetical protein
MSSFEFVPAKEFPVLMIMYILDRRNAGRRSPVIHGVSVICTAACVTVTPRA